MEEWRRRQLHSHSYRMPDSFRDEVVNLKHTYRPERAAAGGGDDAAGGGDDAVGGRVQPRQGGCRRAQEVHARHRRRQSQMHRPPAHGGVEEIAHSVHPTQHERGP
uniref:Uncharacterized protein n=1 Tax=Arundo donax TaxID=35708 RepID=A0A0A8ZV54_ARUDO